MTRSDRATCGSGCWPPGYAARMSRSSTAPCPTSPTGWPPTRSSRATNGSARWSRPAPASPRSRPGDRVVGECSVGCMTCATCIAGDYHRCAAPHRDRHPQPERRLRRIHHLPVALPAPHLAVGSGRVRGHGRAGGRRLQRRAAGGGLAARRGRRLRRWADRPSRRNDGVGLRRGADHRRRRNAAPPRARPRRLAPTPSSISTRPPTSPPRFAPAAGAAPASPSRRPAIRRRWRAP